MKPEALDALTTKTMRPGALEAVVSANPRQQKKPGTDSPDQQQVCDLRCLDNYILTYLSLVPNPPAHRHPWHPQRPSASEQMAPNPQSS
jgi:hypothetical protein